jgi:L-ribulose-5-phosphate 4-epimerase
MPEVRLTRDEISGEYERNTGLAIIRRFADRDISEAPAVLVAGHGPFCWGAAPAAAAHTAVILEELARMACFTVALNPSAAPLPAFHVDRHFLRKHGAAAYYGQK